MRGIAAGLFTLCVATRSFAQPAAPTYEEAKRHYDEASQAMAAGNYQHAVDEFKTAYEISQDPVLFYKIGAASEKLADQLDQPAAKILACREATLYYQRYLDEAKPEAQFVELTHAARARLEASCTAAANHAVAESAGSPAEPAAPAPAPTPAPAPVVAAVATSVNKDRAWLFVGGALAFATAGAVLAYSTGSVEQDVKDLYISNNGAPPQWDTKTQQRLDDLNSQGHRYEVLAWTSFGVAAACGIGAAIFFVRASRELELAPVVTPKQAGAAVTLRF